MLFGIQTVISYHFEMFVRDMNDELFNEIRSGDRFRNQNIIFMSVVMKRNGVTVIMINTGSGDHGSTEISANIFHHFFGIGKFRFRKNIESVWTMFINMGFHIFKRFPNMIFHTIEKNGTERIS